MENVVNAVFLILFLIFIYWEFIGRHKVKTIKAPTTKEIRRERKRKRKIKKIKRFFKRSYHGKSEIIKFDKQTPYIDSIWEELKKH
jgi:hypothetical protein